MITLRLHNRTRKSSNPASSVSPGSRRRSRTMSQLSGTMLSAIPPAMRVTFRLAVPTSGWRLVLSSRSRVSKRDSRGVAARIALTPSSGRPECAARPLTRTSGRKRPLWAAQTAFRVGSPTTTRSIAGGCQRLGAGPVDLLVGNEGEQQDAAPAIALLKQQSPGLNHCGD